METIKLVPHLQNGGLHCYCNIPGKHNTCVFCHQPLTKTHICSGWIEYSRPDRLSVPRWVEPEENRKYGSSLASIPNFNGPSIK